MLYVGETNDANGVIGRLYGHVQSNPIGTFRKQLMERHGLELDEIVDLTVFSCSLPSDVRFYSVEKSYRRGVEYLVQSRLWEVCGDLKPYFYIVSHVEYSDTCRQDEVQKLAAEISERFIAAYSSA